MKNAKIFGIVIFILLGAIVAMYYYMMRSAPAVHIRIAASPWIGYTPFMYAAEKGWFENTPFRFVWQVDMSDSVRLCERGFANGLTSTQYEILRMRGGSTFKPVMLIDRSSGGDAILSNRTIEELRSTRTPVKVYLERNSVGEDFYEAFVREKGLNPAMFIPVHMSQKAISALELKSEDALIVTFQPYLSDLITKGYRPVATTRDMRTFFVIDALFVDENALKGKKAALKQLREIFARAVEQLRKNPQEYYGTIYGYLEGQSYEEFLASTQEIEWLYEHRDDTVVDFLNRSHIRTDRLLR